MKTLKLTLIASAMAMAGAISGAHPAQALEYGGKQALDNAGCAGAGIAAAFKGDFSAWVLPNFIGGNHMKAGQFIWAETGTDGVRRCVVRP